MVNVNVILPIFLLLFVFMCFPLFLQLFIRRKTKGRHLCAILEKDKPLDFKLLKIHKDDFVRDKSDEWLLKTDLMKLVRYPIMWPATLSGFQQIVTCSLVMRGRSDPLDWENPPAGALSSKELPVVLDPHWLINLVKGVGEEGKVSRGERMLLFLAVGAGVISLIMIFFVIFKLGGIEQGLNALRALIR